MATLAAKIVAAAQKLAPGANKLGTGETTPVNGNFGMRLAKSSCHKFRLQFSS